jgi:hypothetical protein
MAFCILYWNSQDFAPTHVLVGVIMPYARCWDSGLANFGRGYSAERLHGENHHIPIKLVSRGVFIAIRQMVQKTTRGDGK